MTELPLSRAPRAPFPSLAELLDGIASDQTLTPRQRQESCSALRSVGRALGRRLDEIQANPSQLRERLATLTPAMAGVSRGRWNNVVSLTRAVLKRAGLATIAGRRHRADVAGMDRHFPSSQGSPDPRGPFVLYPLL